MKVAKCKIHGEDGYVCSYKRDGKYCRKYFYSKKDADSFKRNLENVSTPSAKIVNSFSTAQMDDIVAAVRLLPKGRTLVEAVKKACKRFSLTPLLIVFITYWKLIQLLIKIRNFILLY